MKSCSLQTCNIKGRIFCQLLFKIYWEEHVFFPSVYYDSGLGWWTFIYWTILASLNWSLLDHAEWFFDMFLHFVWKKFIENLKRTPPVGRHGPLLRYGAIQPFDQIFDRELFLSKGNARKKFEHTLKEWLTIERTILGSILVTGTKPWYY